MRGTGPHQRSPLSPSWLHACRIYQSWPSQITHFFTAQLWHYHKHSNSTHFLSRLICPTRYKYLLYRACYTMQLLCWTVFTRLLGNSILYRFTSKSIAAIVVDSWSNSQIKTSGSSPFSNMRPVFVQLNGPQVFAIKLYEVPCLHIHSNNYHRLIAEQSLSRPSCSLSHG